MAGISPIRVTVGGVDYTQMAQNLTWANADPGGCETASFDLDSPQADRIFPGDKVLIWDGMECIWSGRVAEPAKSIQRGWIARRRIGAATTRIQAEGVGAVGKDGKMSMVYLDRELNRWQSPGLQRQLQFAASNDTLQSFEIAGDPGGTPALVAEIRDAWTAGKSPIVEILYDAGPGNLIAGIYYDFIGLTGLVSPTADIQITDSPVFNGQYATSANVYGTTDQIGSFFPSTNTSPNGTTPAQHRYANLQYYDASNAGGGVAGGVYDGYWKSIVVVGNHGLSLKGTLPATVALYTSDIALHAAQACIQANPGSFAMGRVDTITNYQVLDYKQYDPTEFEQIISDMAKLAPAHYGWWPSGQTLNDTAEFTFRAYASTPNVFCSLADCDEADISERLANLYTSARVTYHDAAGAQGSVVVTLPNEVLDRVGIKREADYDIGLSSAAIAQVFGTFALQALYAQGRSAGTVDLPRSIRDANGAPIRSHRLRSGIDRLRINDLPVRYRLLQDSDSFRISRVESNLNSTSGQVQTRVELDAGPNLIETLQARVDAATRLSQG